MEQNETLIVDFIFKPRMSPNFFFSSSSLKHWFKFHSLNLYMLL